LWIEDARLSDGVAWVSVEREERDAQPFWLSVISELPGAVGEEAIVGKLIPTPDFGGEALVRRLLTDLDALVEPLVPVIDDLHQLRSAEALAQVELLLAGHPEPERSSPTSPAARARNVAHRRHGVVGRLRYPVPMTVDDTTNWPCLPWATELLIAIHSGGATMEVASPGAPPGVPDMFVTADPAVATPAESASLTTLIGLGLATSPARPAAA
jgi:hypothetical protein